MKPNTFSGWASTGSATVAESIEALAGESPGGQEEEDKQKRICSKVFVKQLQ